MPDYQNILVERNGPVMRIAHNRPAQRNAETPDLLHELDSAIAVAEADDDIRVIIIAGAGDHFSAGHDLKEAQANRMDFTVEQRWALESKIYFDYCLRIRNCPKPTIAEVQGACIAGGFMVANMCDLVVASDDAYFSDPVVNTLGAAAVEVLIHPFVLGTRKAKEFLFLGERMSAADALAIGMVNRVVPREALSAEVMAMAERVAKASAFGIMLTKRSINRAQDMAGFQSALQAHFDTHQLSHISAEANLVRRGGFTNAIDKAKAIAG